MRKQLNLWLMGVLALAVALGAAPLPTQAGEVRDNAGMFSPSAVKQAEKTIQRIGSESHKDFMVETFPGIPENRKAEFERNRSQFFSEFLREHARSANVD